MTPTLKTASTRQIHDELTARRNQVQAKLGAKYRSTVGPVMEAIQAVAHQAGTSPFLAFEYMAAAQSDELAVMLLSAAIVEIYMPQREPDSPILETWMEGPDFYHA